MTEQKPQKKEVKRVINIDQFLKQQVVAVAVELQSVLDKNKEEHEKYVNKIIQSQ